MAEQTASGSVKTKVAVTRKHLRRDQAAARKARGPAVTGDSAKERLVIIIIKQISIQILLQT